ncbi:MAG: ATP-binding cassette domain-containing protein [Clostridia bacterium]|nr:ATP-binding cassette domain-containing protein [Clostridia bacterium]
MSQISLDIIRKRIAYISGDVFLISASVKDNISLGVPEASIEDIVSVSKMAHCHDFIENMSSGYNTILEENGSNLSSGQKQRIAFARALLMKPDIIILDEATSNLDSVTEKAILNILEYLKGDVTQIIIAHRLNTVRYCDRVYVMDKGAIAEYGTHEELLSAGGCYARFYQAG